MVEKDQKGSKHTKIENLAPHLKFFRGGGVIVAYMGFTGGAEGALGAIKSEFKMLRGVLGSVFGGVFGYCKAIFEAFGIIFRLRRHPGTSLERLGSVLGRRGGVLGHL